MLSNVNQFLAALLSATPPNWPEAGPENTVCIILCEIAHRLIPIKLRIITPL